MTCLRGQPCVGLPDVRSAICDAISIFFGDGGMHTLTAAIEEVSIAVFDERALVVLVYRALNSPKMRQDNPEDQKGGTLHGVITIFHFHWHLHCCFTLQEMGKNYYKTRKALSWVVCANARTHHTVRTHTRLSANVEK